MEGVFASTQPVVQLVNAFAESYNNAVATARTCYSSRVITSADVAKDDKARALRDSIAASTYDAGHHTTLQHATFQFALENVSRQFIWSFLHAHPFYNSEQVSQRYVEVKAERVLIPKLPSRAQALYEQTVAEQMQCYRDLVAMLQQPVGREYFKIFPARQKHADKYNGALKKKAQEVARYALPVATFAHLYHTISGITLHRYHRLANLVDVPHETRQVVGMMVDEVNRIDPLFFARIEDPIALEDTHEYQALKQFGTGMRPSSNARAFRDMFDSELDGKVSRLVDYKVNAESTLARSIRHSLGLMPDQMSDDAAIEFVLSPAKNPYLANALNLSSLGKLTRSLSHVHYTFQKKLSHTADSQDQRHRMTPGSRPILHTHYVGGEPDVIIPTVLSQNQAALDRFMATMQQTWAAIDRLLADEVTSEWALYLLPNAFPIRFEESGDLAAHHHKWTTRLCYTAQEEIWAASLEEVRQVQAIHPRLGRYLQPPCGLRRDAQKRPLCPEGDRYCGVPVWKLKLSEFDRVI